MELRQLRVFEAVARHGTVTDAANVLDLAPSTVSEHVRALETSLGVPLFRRTARGMRVTEAGERLLPWAGRLLGDADRARAEVTGATEPVLRLGALESVAATSVPEVLARLAARRPDIRVDVQSTLCRDDLLREVSGGGLDAVLLLDGGEALGSLGFPVPDRPLAHVDLEPVPLVLVAAPGHPLGGRRGLGPSDLEGERLLVNVPECSFWMAADRFLGSGPERVRAGAVSVMRAWAEAGLGLALLPRFAVADGLAAGKLVPLDIPLPQLRLRLVWRADREALPGLREVLYAAAA